MSELEPRRGEPPGRWLGVRTGSAEFLAEIFLEDSSIGAGFAGKVKREN